MTWNFPLAVTDQTRVPRHDEPGGFGFRRKHHVHEGVDLYCTPGQHITAVEDGDVVDIVQFTGKHAGSPWWNDTWAILVEGESGVVVYGELQQPLTLSRGELLRHGRFVGRSEAVLKKPGPHGFTSMLHLEIHKHGARAGDVLDWTLDGPRPPTLLDPTAHLLASLRNS